MDVILIILGIIISLVIFYFFCWHLPKRYNKFVYIVYGLRNPINLKNNFIGFISFALGVVFISGNFSNQYGSGFAMILGIICIVTSIFLCSKDVRISNISSSHKLLGIVFATFSMLIVVLEVFGLISDLNNPRKGTVIKTVDTGIHAIGVFAFRPELQEQDFVRIESQKLKYPNLDYNSLKFFNLIK